MNNLLRSAITFIMFLIFIVPLYAKEYTVRKGETMTLYCTATAPAGGWITHAFFQCVNSEDSQYLGIAYNSADCKATLYGLKTKTKIPVEVTYAYSYKGSYDNNIHVGSASYIDYVTVSGPREAKSISIREDDPVKIASGQSKVLHVDFYPTGSEGDVYWGFLDVMGQPWCFDGKYDSNGKDFIVTGKKTGSVYVLALLNNDQTTVQMRQIICSEDVDTDELPKEITIDPDKLVLTIGKSETLKVKFIPDNSYSKLSWTSSKESIATVDEDGKVTAVSSGETVITCKTDNGVSSKVQVTVNPIVAGFSIDKSVSVTLGYSYQLTPTTLPKNATGKFRYKSSDTSVIKVSSTGLLTALKDGSAQITVTCDGVEESQTVDVSVKRPDSNTDYRAARARLETIKSLFNQSVIIK